MFFNAKKNCFFSIIFILLFLNFQNLFAQEKKEVAKFAINTIKESLDRKNVDESILLLQKKISAAPENIDKRILFSFLGSIQEQNSAYKDASLSYAKAAGISVSQQEINSFVLIKEANHSQKIVYNMLKKTSSILVLDAVRCSLNAGESSTALNYLNSSIRNSKDEKIIAKVKFYELIAKLCDAKSDAELDEIIVMLKAYQALQSMSFVKPQILFTLWYVSADNDAANLLKKEFPNSVEASVVKGKSQMMPTPFWFFVNKKGNALESVVNAKNQEPKIIVASNKKVESEKSKVEENKNQKPLRQQVGLFGKKDNAQALVDRLKKKGFESYIEEEVRPSGNKYFIVIVNENEQNTMGMLLKTAGFDCYPVF